MEQRSPPQPTSIVATDVNGLVIDAILKDCIGAHRYLFLMIPKAYCFEIRKGAVVRD